MNTIREIEKINQQELDRNIAGTSASWHAQYANSAWCYVGNLDHELTEGDVICILSQFGEIDDVHLVRDDDTGKSRGFGFVKYDDARSCVLAVDNLVGTQILGRSLRIDHVEQYRLPKKLQEQQQQQQHGVIIGQAGHAYEGMELENEYNVQRGMDLFAPPIKNERNESKMDKTFATKEGEEEEREAKRRRKEERRRKRQEKEERRRKKEERRDERKQDMKKKKKKKKHRKRSRHHDEKDEDRSSASGSYNSTDDDHKSDDSHRDRKHKSKKRRHSKESVENKTRTMVLNLRRILPSFLWWIVVTFLGTLSTSVSAWTTTSRTLAVSNNNMDNDNNMVHRRPSSGTTTRLSAHGWNEVPVAIEEELGCSPTLTLLLNRPDPVFFDPLKLATDETFAIYREAELKHGRVAMVSVLSCIMSTLGNEIETANQAGTLETLWFSIVSSVVHGHPAETVTSTDPSIPQEVVINVPINPQQLIPLPSPIALLQEWSVWDYLRMILICGIMETFVWVQLSPTDMPGDYQIGYWGVRDKGLHERSLICELENGRLAMMVMLYYVGMDVWNIFGPQIQ
ncbi:RNA-binding protein [Nitzschia inconspicua]|uniref:RNA-binding protein n=1 Tax=Nitzschia inconspicua TaxID=303405 RepID=A0A9K3PKT0_9STRA|nr:RNA-binding protein [Nitzschia inconspicua]